MRSVMIMIALILAACGGPATSETSSSAAGDAVEVTTPSFTLQPGEEALKCYYTSLPRDEAMSITRLDTTMSSGSHHMIVFFTAAPNQPDGTLEDCVVLPSGAVAGKEIPLPLYLTQKPADSLSMPPGVAMQLEARQSLVIEMHYVNATSDPIDASSTLRATLTHEDVQRADLFATYNKQIAVPPHGTETVSGHCAVPSDAHFFRMTTHTHRHMTSATIDRYHDGQVGEELVRSTDWENPTVRDWSAPYFTLTAGEELYYACSYSNDSDSVVHDGQSARTDEMCMAIGYFFPSPVPAVCLNSTP